MIGMPVFNIKEIIMKRMLMKVAAFMLLGTAAFMAYANGYTPADQVSAPPPGTPLIKTWPAPITGIPRSWKESPPSPENIEYGILNPITGYIYDEGGWAITYEGTKKIFRKYVNPVGAGEDRIRFYDCTSCHPGLKVYVRVLVNPPSPETITETGTW